MRGFEKVRSWFTETRGAEGDYTKQVVAWALATAGGGRGLRELAVYRGCLNQIDHALSVSTVTGEFADVIQPLLGSIGRALADKGEASFVISTRGGSLSLIPASIADVSGPADGPWLYTLNLRGPSGDTRGVFPAASVLSFRSNSDHRTPWRGRAALSENSAALLSQLHAQLMAEVSFKPARLISAGSATAEQRLEITEQVSEGGVITVSGSALGTKDKAAALSAGGLGSGIQEASNTLNDAMSRVVCAALGVPSDLIVGGGESGGKDSWRRFCISTCAPILQIITSEWSEKIGPLEYSIDLLRLADSNAIARAVGSRATAVQKLVLAGVPVDRALELAGLS